MASMASWTSLMALIRPQCPRHRPPRPLPSARHQTFKCPSLSCAPRSPRALFPPCSPSSRVKCLCVFLCVSQGGACSGHVLCTLGILFRRKPNNSYTLLKSPVIMVKEESKSVQSVKESLPILEGEEANSTGQYSVRQSSPSRPRPLQDSC